MDALHIKILCPGQNFMTIGSLLANGLGGYHGALPEGSTIAATTGTPPARLALDGPYAVAEGTYHFAITTPTWALEQAYRGVGPYERPLPLRAIATFPHDDRLALAVRADTGIQSLHDIVRERIPLRLSMPTRDQGHPAGWVLDQIFARYGFSQEDIEDWGGVILRDRPRSQNSPDSIPVDSSFDAVFDEAIMTLRWKRMTTDHRLRFLPLDDDVLAWCASQLMPRGLLAKGRLPGVEVDVPTVDFSGWVLYCSADLPDEIAYLAVQALDEHKDTITARFAGPTPPMTSPFDLSMAGHRTGAPLHPGAEEYYREHGHL